VIQCVAVCCSALQCVAVAMLVMDDSCLNLSRCSVLQCVAVCCSEALVMLYHLLHFINESRQMYEGMSCVVVIWSVLQYDAI